MDPSNQELATFDQLWRDHTWRQIPKCPGRYTLIGVETNLSPTALAGETADVQEYDVTTCRDAVLVAELQGGGLISYRRSDETYVHTLNAPDGFARKLEQLGIG